MRCRDTVLVVLALVLTVGACGEDDRSIAGPTTSQSAATASESLASQDTTSTIWTGTGDPMTTPPAGAGTSSTVSTSVPAPTEHSLVLRHDGLGVVSFGQQVDTVVEVLTELLGPPALQSVQVSPDVDRDVQWDEPFLYLQFTSWVGDVVPKDPDRGPIFHYYLTTSDRLATDRGITAGSTVIELEIAYPDVLFHNPCDDPTPGFLVDPGSEWPRLPIFGLLDGDSDDPEARIVHIGAGLDRTPC